MQMISQAQTGSQNEAWGPKRTCAAYPFLIEPVIPNALLALYFLMSSRSFKTSTTQVPTHNNSRQKGAWTRYLSLKIRLPAQGTTLAVLSGWERYTLALSLSCLLQ